MRILTVPNDTGILRTKSQPVKTINADLKLFLRDLSQTLKSQRNPAGVGLSAIQVGKPWRVFAVFLPPAKSKKPRLTYYLNPQIIKHSDKMTLGEELTGQSEPFLEGCLSIPDLYGPVRRWPWIEAKSEILTESQILPNSKFSLNGLEARVFQHELDHLNGILFTDHVVAEKGQFYQLEDGEMVDVRL